LPITIAALLFPLSSPYPFSATTMPKSTTKASETSTTSTPKSVLDKIIYAIRQSPPSANGGVSRITISKYLKSEFEYDNANQIKAALKRGVSSGTLKQTGQSFVVAKDKPRALAPVGEPLGVEDVHRPGNTDGDDDTTPTAERGDAVTVQYVGKLEDKTTFDSAKSFDFLLGAGDGK
jgi:hypothetical protein